VTLAPPQASTILASLGQAAFEWDIATDAMVWSDQLTSVFPDIPTASLASGAEFAKLIADETDKWGKVIKATGMKPE